MSVGAESDAALPADSVVLTPATIQLPPDVQLDTPAADPTTALGLIEPIDTPEPTASDAPPPTASPTPTRISEILSAASDPELVAVLGGTDLPLPANTSTSWTGCAADGECHWYNFYWAPTREIVLQPGEGQNKVWHEYCHAHQHWSINGGEPLRPSDYDLESWYETAEGISYVTAASGLPWPWTHSAQSDLEDFAWTCGYWYSDPAYLLSVSPERYDWAAANLP